MKDHDISIRKRALDLLYAMCDESSCESIVADLCEFLTSADYSMREELVTHHTRTRFTYLNKKKKYVSLHFGVRE